MNKTSRTQSEIICDLKQLVNEKGYIYTFCNIILHDLFFIPNDMDKINYYEKTSINEVTLLLGLWAQSNNDFSLPYDEVSFLNTKHKTIKLLKELQSSFTDLLLDNFKPLFENESSNNGASLDSIWKKDGMMIEQMFYSDSGIYDFQYLTYLEQKYKYDEEWFIKNYLLSFEEVKVIVSELNNMMQRKVDDCIYIFYPINYISDETEKVTKYNEKHKTKNDDNFKIDLEMSVYQDFFSQFEFRQYCLDLLNLFCFRKAELKDYNVHFFINFTLTKEYSLTHQINKIGDYNVINSHPIIKIDDVTYFLPITFRLFQAVYENPYYGMIKDEYYKDIASLNRGKVGEEMFYNILKNMFPKNCIFKSVKLKANKSETVTDIDVLCVFGNKALIIQVKSKKLTLLSKQGSAIQLEKDFKEAIQEAYEQGLKSRKSILEHKDKLYD